MNRRNAVGLGLAVSSAVVLGACDPRNAHITVRSLQEAAKKEVPVGAPKAQAETFLDAHGFGYTCFDAPKLCNGYIKSVRPFTAIYGEIRLSEDETVESVEIRYSHLLL